MEFSSISALLFILCILFCNAQNEYLPDLQSLDLFRDHPVDIGFLLPDSLLADSSVPSSSSLIASVNNTDNMATNRPPTVPSMSAAKPVKSTAVFSMKNAKFAKPPLVSENMTLHIPATKVTKLPVIPTHVTKLPVIPTHVTKLPVIPTHVTKLPVTPSQVTKLPVTLTQVTISPPPPVEQSSAVTLLPHATKTTKLPTNLDISGKVVHQFLPENVWNDIKMQANSLDSISHTFKDSFNIAESSVLLSDVFKQPWNRQNTIRGSFILPTDPFRSHRNRSIRKKKRKEKLISKYKKKTGRQQKQKSNPSIKQLTNILKRESTLLNIALGLIKKDKYYLTNALLKGRAKCQYKPYRLDKRFFMELVEDAGWIKRRCALGTAYDQETCECSINIGYQPAGCTPEVVMDFNKGVIEDRSENKIPCGIEGVVSLSNLAYFNGASRIIFWRYTNFDFQRSITLKFRFKSQSQSRNAPHPLITNCGTGHDEPSFGVILNSFSDVLTFFVKTTDSEIKFITFKINPMEWNDVIYAYDGEHLTGKVNGLEKRVSVTGNIEIRSAEMSFGHCERYGWFKGFMDDVKIYSCVPKEI